MLNFSGPNSREEHSTDTPGSRSAQIAPEHAKPEYTKENRPFCADKEPIESEPAATSDRPQPRRARDVLLAWGSVVGVLLSLGFLVKPDIRPEILQQTTLTQPLPPVQPADPPRRVHIAASEYGEQWPFLVQEGWLECRPYQALLFYTARGTYAVNSQARDQYGGVYARVQIIQKSASRLRTRKMPLSNTDVIQRGLELCP